MEKRGKLENTYIILLSDHGEQLYDNGIVSKHNKHYDSCVRVPLMIAGPRLEKGKTCEELVQLEDILDVYKRQVQGYLNTYEEGC